MDRSKFVVDMVGRPYEPGKNSDVDAQFSVRYCIATVLLTGSMRLADLKPENALGKERVKLANTIAVDLDDTLKGKWSTRVEVNFYNGRKLTRSRDNAAGQSDRPVSIDELVTKFTDCAAIAQSRFHHERSQTLGEMLIGLPHLPTVGPLCDMLVS
jgi:2-methylcitrate dehydratase PrpD